ncbi:hypothetical protein FisN_17Hu308 [Fistulifera solaris]|uniref:Uncharacterized protein n=1 Tax=Fistulifera solaris TaxID=1519565 RepID=A0A1Z5JH94_FISSO|nr:hypothetical protein FisN_17Hu308 [Fistulifera solaris]|eukprot:GAX13364.1 hypothetical protein FisN_17Hu308 [Fistulifera solaris]
MSSPFPDPTTPDFARRTTPRSRRRESSSLQGFFPENAPLMPSMQTQSSLTTKSEVKRDESIGHLTRRLHREKRRLLLQAAEKPGNETERLREMLLRLSINSSNASGFSTSGSSIESFN